ncbi:alpha/beta fold hydrolase [Eubacteriales bacterium OttesenSCG-928-A19]|nr:alpha/beta fold hydrolase [Eubacteriales bacterium OttesenSCG-928-A19]
MPFFRNEEAELYYEDVGRGRPLVFLHGFSLDVGQWSRQVDHFSREYRVITLDARGHGRSTLPPGKVLSDVFWRDVVALLDHLRIPKAILCGLSMGGHVAIQVAIHAPARVDGLILIGSICTNRFNTYERLVVPVNRLCQRLMPMRWIAWGISVGMGSYNRKARPYIRQAVQSMSHDVYNRAWRAVSTMESRAGLPGISCPVLLLIGDHDSMTRRQQQYMHAHIRGSRLVTIERAHHGTNLDNPEQVEREIERFLDETAL